MSLRSFLDSLAQSPAAQRSFFEVSRHAMLRAMARKYPYLPHQILEDAAMQAFGQLWEEALASFCRRILRGPMGIGRTSRATSPW